MKSYNCITEYWRVQKDIICRLTVNRPITIATRIDLAKQQHGCKQRSIRNETVHTRHGQFLRS